MVRTPETSKGPEVKNALDETKDADRSWLMDFEKAAEQFAKTENPIAFTSLMEAHKTTDASDDSDNARMDSAELTTKTA